MRAPSRRSTHLAMAVAATTLVLGLLESTTSVGLAWPFAHLLLGVFWLAAFASTCWLMQIQRMRPTWLRHFRLLLLIGLWLAVLGVTLGWLLRGEDSPPVHGPDGAEYLVRSIGLIWPIDVVVERRRLIWPLHHERIRGSFERERVLALQPGPNAELRVVVEEFGKPPRTVELSR